MWVVISIMLHGILFLGGFFHWKNYDVVSKESSVTKMSMSFSSNAKISEIKNIVEKDVAEKNPIKKIEIEKKVEKKKVLDTSPKKIQENSSKKREKIEKIETQEREISKSTENSLTDSGVETPRGELQEIEGVTEISEGVYVAKNQGVAGLKYEIFSQESPEYPDMAKKLGYRKTVEIKVKFLVGDDGKIEEIKFYGDDIGMGFRNEVERALKKWKFSPITLKERKVKMYFYKAFIFNQI